MTNKELLKKIEKNISLQKQYRKQKHPDHNLYIGVWPLEHLSDEARHRSIINALKNRKWTLELLEEKIGDGGYQPLNKLLVDYGIESKRNLGTTSINPKRLRAFWESVEALETESVA